MSKKLIFVYNGDSGLVNSVIHLLHKKFSPGTYDCQLCMLVYDGVSMDKDWMSFIDGLNIETEFLHRNIFVERYGATTEAFPAVFLNEDGYNQTVIAATEFKRIKTLDTLMAAVRRIAPVLSSAARVQEAGSLGLASN